MKFIPASFAPPKPWLKSMLKDSLSSFHRSLALKCYFSALRGNSDCFYTKDPIPKISNNSFLPPITPDIPILTKLSQHFTTLIQSVDSLIPRCTLPPPHHQLVLSTLISLRNRTDLVFKPADKNLGITVMTYEHYRSLVLEHLLDTSTYKPLPLEDVDNSKSPAQQMHVKKAYARLRRVLSEHKRLYASTFGTRLVDQLPQSLSKLARSLLQLSSSDSLRSAGKFYILPKLHKPKLSSRPIASCINTLTYHASKYLDNVLQPIMKSLPTICLSTWEALVKIDQLHSLPDSTCIVTADVKNLYPSIPINFGITCMKDILTNHPLLNPGDLNFVLDLLRWVLENNYIAFENQTYLQISGTAMGTPVAVSYANIVLHCIERKCLSPISGSVILYLRYIDDLFIVMSSTQAGQQFITAFNGMNPSIQLDAVNIGTAGIFLDMDLSFSALQRKITVKSYQKPTNKYLYLPPTSAHRMHIFSNFIYNELVRYRLLNSNITDYLWMVSTFKIRLKRRGYSEDFLAPIFNNLPVDRNFLLHTIAKKISSANFRTTRVQSISKPILILNSPHLRNAFDIRSLSKLPPNISDDPHFTAAFGCNVTAPIITSKVDKNMECLLTHNARNHFPSSSPHRK